MKKNDNQLIGSKGSVNFWLCGLLLVLLLASITTRDINRPFYGLHSWAEAHGPWHARVHLTYGLGYTKGWLTKAVGNPPTENPSRYLDHPQLPSLMGLPFYIVLGEVSEWSYRTINISMTILSLLLFLRILRGLVDEKTALLGGLFFCLFPVIGFFGVNFYLYPFTLWAIWNYLVLIKSLDPAPEPKKRHMIFLAISLFMMMQISWEGFFFAFPIGLHYIVRCITRKTFPNKTLLAVLFFAPVGSLFLTFTRMAAGYNWEVSKIVDLFAWRSGSGELKQHVWSAWFAKFWEFAITDFTLPILIITILYLTLGQLFIVLQSTDQKDKPTISRRFPQFWLFFLPPVLQLFILKGCLWKHQTWIRPFCFFLAIGAALGVMLIGDILKKINKRLAIAAMTIFVAVIFITSVIGTNHYYGIRWQSPQKINLLKKLKAQIPPDKYLLSFEDFIVNQHKAKGAFYRPEIAWYLDREIVQARTFPEIQKYAKTGKFPYYLTPYAESLAPLIGQLQKQYKFEYIQRDPGQSKNGKFYQAGMPAYMIFDLNSKM